MTKPFSLGRIALVAALPLASALALPSASLHLAPRQQSGDGPCASFHLLLARGWNEEYPGRQSLLVDALCSTETCDYEDIVFDTLTSDALSTGHAATISQLKAYSTRCPSSQFVLTGYSLGASIVGDALADTSLDPSSGAGANICAALLWGDPGHAPDQPYNTLDGASGASTGPRTGESLDRLNRFADVLISYCNAGDPICAQGDGGEEAHTNYFNLYAETAAEWVMGKCPGIGSGGGGGGDGDDGGQACIAGTKADGLSDGYLGLCEYACHYDYCPEGVCTCTQTGTAVDPPATMDGQDGCPAAGLDESFKGLCSFAGSRGYVPDVCVVC